MSQSSRLLNYVEEYNIGGFQKTKLYTQLNTDYKLNNKIFISGGNLDSYNIALNDPYSKFAMGYKIIVINYNENWLVIDRDFDNVPLTSNGEDLFLSKSIFKRGQFNGGQFNDGIFGDSLNTSKCLFNNKQEYYNGPYIINAEVNHVIWIDGKWNGGQWNSKTDSYNSNFKSIIASLNNGTINVNLLTNDDINNNKYGYNIWVDGTWVNGTWENGTWENGTWENGTFSYGLFKGGFWKNGTKNGGKLTSLNSRVIWENGLHNNGSMDDCYWDKGTFSDGDWNGSNNFKIESISNHTNNSYNNNQYIAINLKNVEYLNIFNVNDIITVSYLDVNKYKSFNSYISIDLDLFFPSFEIIDIINNEIIIKVDNKQKYINSDYSNALVSNSTWRHGIWEYGNWNSGNRRSGYEVNLNSLDVSSQGFLVLEINQLDIFDQSTYIVPYDLRVGESIILTNLKDSNNNFSENYLLKIDSINIGNNTNTTELVLSNVPNNWNNGIYIRENDNIYLDNTIWINGNFNSGLWENGYFRNGNFNATINDIINNNFSLWKKGQWSNLEYDDVNNNHSIWNNGLWNNGIFINGEWKNGIWLNGKWESDYTINNGKYSAYWRNGYFISGVWLLGSWDNGEFGSSSWEKGTYNKQFNAISFNLEEGEIINDKIYLTFKFNNNIPLNDYIEKDSLITIENLSDPFLEDMNGEYINNTTYKIKDVIYSNNTVIVITDHVIEYIQPDIITIYICNINSETKSFNVFNNGNFDGGDWYNGEFNNGVFIDSFWYNGNFNNGEFIDNSFSNGNFNNGEFIRSSFSNGIFNNGIFKNSIFVNGKFINGLMKENSIFYGGEFIGGEIKNSKIVGGDIKGGNAYNSILEGGNLLKNHNFNNGIINGGIIDGAIVTDSIKNNGVVKSGVLKGTNNIHEGGSFRGGEWLDGIWNNGIWESESIESNVLTYDHNINTNKTFLHIYKSDEINHLRNGTFNNGANWDFEPNWSINTGGLLYTKPNGASGIINTFIKQNKFNTFINLESYNIYKIYYEIVSNTHPWEDGPIISPSNSLSFQIGNTINSVVNSSVGTHHVFFNVNNAGTGSLDFRINLEILSNSSTNNSIKIDNIKIVKLDNIDLSGFENNSKCYVDGLKSRLLSSNNAFIPINTVGKVSTSNNRLSIQYDSLLEIQKNYNQKNYYVSLGIWRSGDIKEGDIKGMIFKSGNIYKPLIEKSVLENCISMPEVEYELDFDGLTLNSINDWDSFNGWSVNYNSLRFSPVNINYDYYLTKNNVLTINDYFLVTINILRNNNYLDDTLRIKLGSNEYNLGSSKQNKTYKIYGLCESNTNFSIIGRSSIKTLNSSDIKINNIKIEKINSFTLKNNSTWINGKANNIHIIDSEFINGEFNNSIIENSKWINGTSNYGHFINTGWEDGIWEDGSLENYNFNETSWKSGVWKDGFWKNGEWECGIFKGGIWENGMFKDGKIKDNVKFKDGAIQYGDIEYRNLQTVYLNLDFLDLDINNNTIEILLNDFTNFKLTASKQYSNNNYPSGDFTQNLWGGSNQPSWVNSINPYADWSLDSQKLILRDILDYNINNKNNVIDLFDVDFVKYNNITNNYSLSGNGIIETPNNQQSNIIRITNKMYNNNIISKGGTSNISAMYINSNNIGIHVTKTTSIGHVGTLQYQFVLTNINSNNGVLEMTIQGNFTNVLNNNSKIYIYETGIFNSNISNINKDGYHEVTNVQTTGNFPNEITTITTNTFVTGNNPPIINNKLIKMWINVDKKDKYNNHIPISLGNYGRYFSILITGNHFNKYTEDDEITILNASDQNLFNNIKKDFIYIIKKVLLEGSNTRIVINLRVTNFQTYTINGSIELKKISKIKNSNNFCLGGNGPT